MGDIVVSGIVLCIAFLLITQLAVLDAIRQLRRIVLTLVGKVEQRQSQTLVAQFETESESHSRRYKFRAPSKLDGILTVAANKIKVQLNDISETGALLHSEHVNLEMGEFYPLSFSLADQTVETKARVARVLKDSQEYGISFQDLKISAKQLIRDHVKRSAESELAGELTSIR